MESINLFVMEHWDGILAVAALIAGVIVLYRRGEVTLLKNALFTLVIRAEREFGSGTGEVKKAAVIQWVYERLPTVARLIISQKVIERYLEAALDVAKQKWAANPHLRGYINGNENK